MTVSLADFERVADNPRDWLKEWRSKTGRKVIGCFPLYVPEEIIHAADMLPVVLQGSDKPIAFSNQYLHSNVCHPVLGNFDQALRGEMDYVDGLVISDVCEQAKRASSLWKIYHSLPYHHNIIFPKTLDQTSARGYLVYELNRFRTSLEKLGGKAVTTAALRESIALYNRTRSLLSRLYQGRRQQPGAFTTAEVATIVEAAMLLPKEDFNPLLERYLAGKETKAAPDHRVRLLLAANPCEDLEPGFCEMMDEVEAEVVDDDLYWGYRYFAVPVSERGDPIEALAEAHLSLPACPTRHHAERDWPQFIIDRAQAVQAKGVVLLLQKFCEIHAFEYPYLRDKFKQAGLPVLLLESDHSGATGRVKTRLEAFLEMID